MKLSRKLVMVSAAALMTVSPLAAPVVNSSVAQAATKKSSNTVHKTYGKNSKVTVTKGQNFVNENGKKTSKKAPKGGEYIIWDVKEINGETYYSIQTDLKYWIPAVNTKGKVEYKTGSTTVTLTTDGKKVVQTESSAKKTSKKSSSKSSKTTSKKTVAKSEKKETTKDSKKSESKVSSKKETTSTKDTKKSTKSDSKKTTAKKTDSKSSTKKEDSKKTATKSDKKSTTTTKKSETKTSTKKSTKKEAIKLVKITATKKTPVVDKDGKKVKTYMGSKKYTVIGKGVTVNGLGTKKINGKTYYALQPNHYYVLASDFKTAK